MLIRGLWGIHITPEQDYIIKVQASFKITMASLGQFEGSQRTSVYMQFQDNVFLLCSLTPRKIEQQVLDITCLEGESVIFRSKGPNTIHLMGNYISQEGLDDQDESDEGHGLQNEFASSIKQMLPTKPNDAWQLYDDLEQQEIEEEDDSDEDGFNPFDIFQNLGLTTNKKKKHLETSSRPLSQDNTLFSPDDDLPSIPEPKKKTNTSQLINNAVSEDNLKLQKKSEKKQARREKKRQERLESKQQQSKSQQNDTQKKKKKRKDTKTAELSQKDQTKLSETTPLLQENTLVNNHSVNEPITVAKEREKTIDDQSSLNEMVSNTLSTTKKLGHTGKNQPDTVISPPVEDNPNSKAVNTQSKDKTKASQSKSIDTLPKLETSTKAIDFQSKDTTSSMKPIVSRYPRRRATAESAEKLRMIAKADATVAASVRRQIKKKRASSISNHNSQQPTTKKVKNDHE